MSPTTARKRPRRPPRPPPTYVVEVVPPAEPDPQAAAKVLAWLADRAQR